MTEVQMRADMVALMAFCHYHFVHVLHVPFFRVFFSLLHYSMFFSFFRCRALSSRSHGFGLHSPNLLISHVAGLVVTVNDTDVYPDLTMLLTLILPPML